MIATLTSSSSCTSGRQLAHRHLEAAVADDRPRLRRRAGAILAPIAAGSAKPIVPRPPDVMSERGAFVVVVLRFPHLVLADVGDDDRVAVA